MVRKLFEQNDEVVEPFALRRPIVVFGLSTTAVAALMGGIVKFVIMSPTASAAAPVTNEEIRNALAQHHTEMVRTRDAELPVLYEIKHLLQVQCLRSSHGQMQQEECLGQR